MNRSTYAFGILCLLIPLCITCSCYTNQEDVQWEEILLKYNKEGLDGVKAQALNAIRGNYSDFESELIFIKERNAGNERLLSDSLRVIGDTALFQQRIESGEIKSSVVVKNDAALLTTGAIKHNIDYAYQILQTMPWRNDIPPLIFVNNLAPYKIFTDYPSTWRITLLNSIDANVKGWQRKYPTNYLQNKTKFIDDFVNQVILPAGRRMLKYSERPIKLTRIPSLAMILASGKGDCQSEAILNYYLLNAAGLPAAVDYIPAWGNVNGGHATVVYWNPGEQKFRLPMGFTFRPAKVFRWSFIVDDKRTAAQARTTFISINQKFGKDSEHIIDVTAEHVATSTVRSRVPDCPDGSSVFLCVYNYESWVPLVCSKAEKGLVNFEALGRGVIYRIKIENREGQLSYGRPFLLRENGSVKFPDLTTTKQNMSLSHINSGEKAYVRKGTSYLLSIMNFSGELIPVKMGRCQTNGEIHFPNVPVASFYQLSEYPDHRKLARFFEYNDQNQVWY